MRKLLSLSVVLAGATFLSSCSAIDAIADGGRINATYELTSVNGTRIPAVVYQEPGYRREILTANFTLESDGSDSVAGIVRPRIRQDQLDEADDDGKMVAEGVHRLRSKA